MAQSSHDVLHVDDRVVDDDTDGDDEPRQDHHVDNGAERLQHENSREQRQRNRDQADERGAPLEEEGGQDQDHEQNAEQQRPREVAERLLDEGGRPEDRGVKLHAGKARAHVVDRLFDAPRHRERVGVRELLNDQHQAAAIIDDGVTD